MIKNAICLLITENIYNFRQKTDLDLSYICLFIIRGLNHLPWFYRFPITSYLAMIGVLTFYRPERLPAFIKRFPLFPMINKLIRSLTFLAMDDVKKKTA